MSGGFEADPRRLAAEAGEFTALAERARTVARDLADALDTAPRPWGSDAVGESFAAVHVEAADRARAQTAEVAEAFEQFGAALREASTAYGTADTDAADAVRAVEQPDHTR